eukprot:CAMPEP_0119428524 /NCGR_PEP_ID=MMETSP1335-20130426/40634_1 /TAXON_ID=259385 /ORGANISM="Chrysoculter rhomboideus, Strain RCC1486" /LENGTH=179 /DNA_ID=CAMNT_0007454215 /DNA_START=69 /DNA_END=608 /DNA_ORIENTATION=-
MAIPAHAQSFDLCGSGAGALSADVGHPSLSSVMGPPQLVHLSPALLPSAPPCAGTPGATPAGTSLDANPQLMQQLVATNTLADALDGWHRLTHLDHGANRLFTSAPSEGARICMAARPPVPTTSTSQMSVCDTGADIALELERIVGRAAPGEEQAVRAELLELAKRAAAYNVSSHIPRE